MTCLGTDNRPLGPWEWLLCLAALIVAGLALLIAFKIGEVNGERKCDESRRKLKVQLIRAKAITNKATIAFFTEQELKESCLEIVGQATERGTCYGCHN